MGMSKLAHVLGAFLAALAGQPLVVALAGGADVSFTKQVLIATFVAAVVATMHKLDNKE